MPKRLRRLALLTTVAALLVPVAHANTAGATEPRPAAVPGAQGVYISPWGSAHVSLSEETKQWIAAENVTLEAIEPFRLDSDGNGFEMPIGSTAGDHLDSKGRIFYPGGIKLHHPASGHTFTLQPTYIRVMPTLMWTSGLEVDGRPVTDEFQVAYSSYPEAMVGARPTFTGWEVQQVPFHISQQASDLIAQYINRPGPEVGTLFGTLTPHFDYVPTRG